MVRCHNFKVHRKNISSLADGMEVGTDIKNGLVTRMDISYLYYTDSDGSYPSLAAISSALSL